MGWECDALGRVHVKIKSGPEFGQIIEWADSLVREAALTALDGPAKRKRVVKALSTRIDDALKFGPGPAGRLAEWADGRLAELLLTPLVHKVYESLGAAGEL